MAHTAEHQLKNIGELKMLVGAMKAVSQKNGTDGTIVVDRDS